MLAVLHPVETEGGPALLLNFSSAPVSLGVYAETAGKTVMTGPMSTFVQKSDRM